MKRWIRWTLRLLFTVVALLALAIAAGLILAERRMHRHIEVKVRAVALPTDAALLARGQYLFQTRGCAECHGANGGGRIFIDDGAMKVAGPHISAGPNSVTAAYTIEDWVRTVRHGVKPDGRPVFIMPSEDYNRLTDADLGALIAHVKRLPATPGQAAVTQLPLPVRVLYGFGQIPDAAARIDHSLPPEKPVPEGVTAEHGRYIAHTCIGCHGEGLSGGRIAGGPPDWPPAANLTPGEGSVMPRYADAQSFVAMFRSGKRPDGTAIPVMPFGSFGAMSEVDLRALHAYLKTVPAKPAGQH